MPVQLLEGVLDNILRGGQVTDHQHGQANKFQLVTAEQRGHRPRGVVTARWRASGASPELGGICVHNLGDVQPARSAAPAGR